MSRSTKEESTFKLGYHNSKKPITDPWTGNAYDAARALADSTRKIVEVTETKTTVIWPEDSAA